MCGRSLISRMASSFELVCAQFERQRDTLLFILRSGRFRPLRPKIYSAFSSSAHRTWSRAANFPFSRIRSRKTINILGFSVRAAGAAEREQSCRPVARSLLTHTAHAKINRLVSECVLSSAAGPTHNSRDKHTRRRPHRIYMRPAHNQREHAPPDSAFSFSNFLPAAKGCVNFILCTLGADGRN